MSKINQKLNKKKVKIMSKYELPKKFDYKDIDILKQFITETGKIIPARVTGVSASNQRKVTKSGSFTRFDFGRY